MMKRLSALFIAALLLCPDAARAEVVRVKAKGLVCDYCVRAMEKVIRKRPEVQDLKIDLTTKQVELTLKEGQTLDDKTITELVIESGYTVDTIERE